MFHPQGPTFSELARQALSSTRRGYDLLAPKFEYTPFCTSPMLLEHVAPAIGLAGSVSCGLDFCCGTGAGLRMLRPLCRDGLVGLDFSRGMLRECAREIAGMPGDAPVALVQADALAMPFSPSFDVVTCFGALGHIRVRDEARFLAEVARVLRPGGRFIFLTARAPPWRSASFWMSHAFNLAMRVRNRLWSPEFVMYYLTFLWPDIAGRLAACGFHVSPQAGLFPPPYSSLLLVSAVRPRHRF